MQGKADSRAVGSASRLTLNSRLLAKLRRLYVFRKAIMEARPADVSDRVTKCRMYAAMNDLEWMFDTLLARGYFGEQPIPHATAEELSWFDPVEFLKSVDLLAEMPPTRAQVLTAIFLLLRDETRWRSLAHAPSDFNKQLESLITTLRATMKASYGIRSGRVQAQHDRDFEMWCQKQKNPRLSPAQIGQRHGLKGTAAHQAIDRFDRRHKLQSQEAVDELEWIVAAVKALGEAAEEQFAQTKHVPQLK